MNMNLMCEKLISHPDLKDIPLIFILRVAIAVFEIINTGECFYERSENDVYTTTTADSTSEWENKH